MLTGFLLQPFPSDRSSRPARPARPLLSALRYRRPGRGAPTHHSNLSSIGGYSRPRRAVNRRSARPLPAVRTRARMPLSPRRRPCRSHSETFELCGWSDARRPRSAGGPIARCSASRCSGRRFDPERMIASTILRAAHGGGACCPHSAERTEGRMPGLCHPVRQEEQVSDHLGLGLSRVNPRPRTRNANSNFGRRTSWGSEFSWLGYGRRAWPGRFASYRQHEP